MTLKEELLETLRKARIDSYESKPKDESHTKAVYDYLSDLCKKEATRGNDFAFITLGDNEEYAINLSDGTSLTREDIEYFAAKENLVFLHVGNYADDFAAAYYNAYRICFQ